MSEYTDIKDFDFSSGMLVEALVIDDNRLIISPTTGVYVNQIAVNPDSWGIKANLELDPKLQELKELHEEVQRTNTGRKKKNVDPYGDYLFDVWKGNRMGSAPAPVIISLEPIQLVVDGKRVYACIPFDKRYVTVDGDTQTRATFKEMREHPEMAKRIMPVEVFHGIPVEFGRQIFHDRNVEKVGVNTSEAIAMDSYDVATRIVRRIEENSDFLNGKLKKAGRSVAKSDKQHVVTISALRTGVTTTLLGTSGLQVGAKAVSLPDGVDLDRLEEAATDVWVDILASLEDAFVSHATTVVSSSSVLAGIGVVAHHAMPIPPRDGATPSWTVDEVLEALDGVNWERVNADGTSSWDGVGGKFTPSGTFSVGGPKEVGHGIAAALENPASPHGQQIRK